MGQVPIFFDNAFIEVSYSLTDMPERIVIDVAIEDPFLSIHTGKEFSICYRKTDRIMEIPMNNSVDRALKFQLVAKILRQENMEDLTF